MATETQTLVADAAGILSLRPVLILEGIELAEGAGC